MNQQAFSQFLSESPALQAELQAVAQDNTQFSVVTDAAMMVVLYPVVRFVVTELGLPWLHEVKRYSELQRQRFHRWIDSKYDEAGFDVDKAEKVGEKLLQQLEKTQDARLRQDYERLAMLLKEDE